MILVEIFAKHPAVTATEEMELLLTVTRTHSGAFVRYAERENHLKRTPQTPFTCFTLKFKVN